MITIKDYKFLCDLREFAVELRDIELKDNNNFSNIHIDKLNRYISQLTHLISKLENADE